MEGVGEGVEGVEIMQDRQKNEGEVEVEAVAAVENHSRSRGGLEGVGVISGCRRQGPEFV